MSDFEHLEMDPDKMEVRMTRSDYAQVVFRNIAETYPVDSDVDVLYTVTRYHSPSKRDWVGVYKVGWASSKDYLFYHWAQIPSGYQQGTEYEAKLTFAASALPSDDGEFYQFCYVTSAGQVRGASTPFQFKKPSAQDFVEVEDVDNDIMVVQSRTSALEQQLEDMRTEKQEVLQQKQRVQRDMESYLNKLMETEKSLLAEKQEKDALKADLKTTQDKVASLHGEAKGVAVLHKSLTEKYEQASRENATLEDKIAQLEVRCEQMKEDIKTLKGEKDRLTGKCRSMEQEKDLYMESLTKSTDTLKDNSSKLEAFQNQHKEDQQEILSLREATRQLQTELQDEKMKLHSRSSASEKDKKVIGDMRTQLQAVNEQLEALKECKQTLGTQLDSLMQAHDKVTGDLEKSTSDVYTLKRRLEATEQQLEVTEQSKQRMTDKLNSELAAAMLEIEAKTAENARLGEETAKLSAALESRQEDNEGSLYALKLAQAELTKRMAKTDGDKKALEKEVGELKKYKVIWESREKDMKREIEDLKERLVMGQEEYKSKYIECKKLQSMLRRSKVSSRDSSMSTDQVTAATKTTETPRRTEAEQTTQTAHAHSNSEQTTQTNKDEKHGTTQTKNKDEKNVVTQTSMNACENAADLSNDEIQQQLAELSKELEDRCQKKIKYKRLYLEEKEKQTFMQKHYHEQLEERDAEISQLREKIISLENERTKCARAAEQVESINNIQKDTISHLEALLVDKSRRSPPLRDITPPQPTPRASRTSTPPGSPPRDSMGGWSLMGACGYGNSPGAANEMISKANSLASEASTLKASKSSQKHEGDEDEHMSTHGNIPDEAIRSELLKEYDPLSQDGASGQSAGTDTEEKTVADPAPPATNMGVTAVKEDGKSTIYNEGSKTEERGSYRSEEPEERQVTVGSVTGPASAPREDLEEFYDAPTAPPVEGLVKNPECPVCKLVFPAGTGGTVINEHANTHFGPLPYAQPVPRPQPKRCMMCPKTFRDDEQDEFEAHVNSHLD